MTPTLDAVRREELRKLAEAAHVAEPSSWVAEPHQTAGGVLLDEVNHGFALLARIAELEAERDELQAVFDGTWKADQRAIKRWQAANPGNDLVWPDRADMVVWLLDRDAELEAVEAALAEVEKQWPGSFWLMSKGRLSEKEPLYGFQVLFGTDDVLAEGEGDTAAEAVLAALLPKASVREERG